MKKVLYVLSTILMLTLLIVGMTLSASAEEDVIHSGTWGDLTWELNETTGHLTISGEGSMNDLGSSTNAWRAYSASIKMVTIEEDVASIGKYAFAGCSSLTSINVPSSVTNIGYNAFYGCTNVIQLDNGVSYVEKWVTDCDTSIVTASLKTDTVGIGNSAFENCSRLTSIEIPEGVTFIGDNAFEFCSGLISIEIPDGVTSIGFCCFRSCTSLTSIEIPDSVTSIGNQAFDGCNSLTNIEIPRNVKNIGSSAFSNCRSLMSIEIPSSVTSIRSTTFSNCSSLISIIVESGNIEYHSDGDCLIETKSKTLILGCQNSVIPSNGSVTRIGNQAFYNCSTLMSIQIPSSVTDIGSFAFYNCSGLMNIEFLSGVTSIESYAFSGCSSLTNIEIPRSVRRISDSAFSKCSALASINIPNQVTYLGSKIFNSCSKLANIVYCGTQEQWDVIYKESGWDTGVGQDTSLGTYTLSFHAFDVWAPNGHVNHIEACVYCGQHGELCEPHIYDSDSDMICDECLFNAAILFDSSMQAFLNLEDEITMSVGYKVNDMDSFDIENLNGRFGLLIWRAGDLPEVFDYENCDYIVSGAIYNPEKGRFETTSLGIAAKNLGDQLYFRAYFINKDGSYSYSRLIEDYSPKTYCYNQINNNPDDGELIHLMASILNYGAAAQIHFNYRTADLMNSDLAAELQEMNWDGSLLRSDYAVPNNKDSAFVRDASVTSRGGYLDLQGAIDYNFYAKVDFEPVTATIYYWTESDVAKLDELTLDNATSSESMKWVAENNRWEGKYEGQAAKRMFNTVYACMVFEDAEGNTVCSGVVGYSPERYAYINQNKGDTNAELAKRLAVYGDAARTYFENID